jgi:hypothetical protein
VAFVLNDRVKETTTTTGTGTVNLGGAATGFETFVAGVGNSNSTYYCIAGQTTAEFEVGIGTVTDASPDTLSRTTILSSSNSDSAVDFSAGTKDVFCTLPAAKTIREFDTAVNIPTGTTAQRSSSAAAGDFRYNTSTGRFEGYSSAWNALGGSNTFSTDIFTGDGSDTTFTLSQSIENENDLLVFIDGVFQAHNSYSVSGTTLTFSTAPANGRVITAYSVKSAVSGNNVTISTMDGDGSDTTLTLAADPINENNVQVYIDGVYQNKDTFAVSGTTLTFSAAPPNGTKVEAITLTQTNINTATQLADADGDTKVQVEESSDEDTIRMDIAGTEVLTLTNSAMTLKGTTPTLTIGDAGAEDTKIVFDGNAQDYYIGLDDSADDLIIGKGSTVGTTPAVVIDENLNVGIGTTSPARPLHIENAEGRLVRLSHTSNPKIEFVDTTNGTSGAYLGSEDNELTFETSGQNERMRIDAAGNVGIGAAPTLGALHVTSSLTDIVTFENTDAGTTGAQLLLYHNSSSPADGDRVGALAFQGKDDGGNHTTYAGIRCLATDVSDGGEDGTLTFSCTREGSFTEAMRIDSGGGVAIGTTSPDGVSNLTVKSQNSTAGQELVSIHHTATSGTVYFMSFMTEASGVDRGYITYNQSDVAFTQASDISLKENIRDLTGGLDLINQIKPRVFDWKEEGRGSDKVGFIAQEIEEIKPEWVEEKEGIKLLNSYLPNTIPYLIKAIQEQQTLIETLQAKVEALENG